MNKKSLWALLFSMMFLFAVEDDGAGGGDDSEEHFEEGDIGDFEIEDDEPEEKQEAKKQDIPPDNETSKLEERIESLEAEKAQQEAEREVLAETDRLKSQYKGFDIEKIADKLKGMTEQEQALYNNPAGWEALHLKFFNDSEARDMFDPGRKVSTEPFDLDKSYEVMHQGGSGAVAEILRNARG